MVKDDVLAALTNEYDSPRAIWLRMKCWGLGSVHAQLRVLHREGKVERRVVTMRHSPTGVANLYRRAEPS